MSYYLYNPSFYNSGSLDDFPSQILPKTPQINYSDYQSNRMTRKGQIIEQESVLRRLKVASQIHSAHQEQEISAMRIKHQLDAMNLNDSNGQKTKVKLSKDSEIIAQNARMELAAIEGYRRAKKQANISNGHEFPSYISSLRKGISNVSY